jgi:hypothetical protein
LKSSLDVLLNLKSSSSVVCVDFSVILVEVEPTIVAEQMCLIDVVFFRSVPKSELLLCDVLSNANVESVAPNWFRMVSSFNHISQWVVSSILQASLPSSRAELIVFFLKIADHLQNVLANFNAS